MDSVPRGTALIFGLTLDSDEEEIQKVEEKKRELNMSQNEREGWVETEGGTAMGKGGKVALGTPTHGGDID